MPEKTETKYQLNIDWTDNGEPWECFCVASNRRQLRYFDKTFVREVERLYAESTDDPVKMTSVLRKVAGEFEIMGLNEADSPDIPYDHIMDQFKDKLFSLAMSVDETYWHEPTVSWDWEYFVKKWRPQKGKMVLLTGKFMVDKSELSFTDEPCLIYYVGYDEIKLKIERRIESLDEWDNCVILVPESLNADWQDPFQIRPEAEDEKARRVAIDAEFAFWEVVRENYPEGSSDGWMCDLQSEENVSRWLQSEAGGE